MIDIEVGIMCRSVYASNKSYDWTLSIRKVNDSEVGDIAKKHKETVDSQYISDYLPGWEKIIWKWLNTPAMFPKELHAVCGDYNLNIILKENNTKTENEIVQEFNEFMHL